MSKIIDKIRALLAKTTGAGCTEAEAMAAAEVARRLMLEHDLADADVAEREAFVTRGVKAPVARGIEDWLSGPVASFFDCKAVKSSTYDHARGRRGAQVRFFGREADTIMAEWLFGTLVRTAKRDYKAWLAEARLAPARSQTNGFYLGFAHRVSERLNTMRAAQREEMPATHAALVVKQHAARDAAFAVAFPKSRPSIIRSRETDRGSVASGRSAGDAASLSRPVGASAGPTMLR